MQEIIYFDNAATTWPKPQSVYAAVNEAMRSFGGNPGRGTHRMAMKAEELLFDCRQSAADLFNTSPENVVFTMNATHALNYAIKGLAFSGCHILIDNYAHNASFRPASSLKRFGCSVEIYNASGSDDETLADLESRIRYNTAIVIATHKSNICSKTLNIDKIGVFCGKRGISYIVDASQSAGNTEIDFLKTGASAICMPGHKGLYGPMGIGIMLCKPDVKFRTIIEGGAGIRSKDLTMPDELPERLEAGTLPLPAVAGLRAGIEWVKRTGIARIADHEKHLSLAIEKGINRMPGIQICGSGEGAVLSLISAHRSTAEICEVLDRYGICVRGGFHCAPLAHRTLGSETNGTVRLSFSYMNKMSEVNSFIEVMERIF